MTVKELKYILNNISENSETNVKKIMVTENGIEFIIENNNINIVLNE